MKIIHECRVSLNEMILHSNMELTLAILADKLTQIDENYKQKTAVKTG